MPASYPAGPWFARCDRCGHEERVEIPDGANFGIFEKIMRSLGWRMSPYSRTTTGRRTPDPKENPPCGDLCPTCAKQAGGAGRG